MTSVLVSGKNILETKMKINNIFKLFLINVKTESYHSFMPPGYLHIFF